MSKFALSLFAAALILPAAVGCSQNSNLVRGQSAEPVQEPLYAPGPGGPQSWTPVHTVHGPYDGAYHGPAYGQGPFSQCLPDCRYTGGVLPPAGDLPAVVQYPYYTVKGPDCFFHQ